VLVGPSQTGKSTICGQILNKMGEVKKVEINRCIQVAMKYKNSSKQSAAPEKGAELGQ